MRFQMEALRAAYHRLRGQKPWLVIRVDLTSIEKTGKSLPYTRTYNGVFGIHLVVLHVSIGKLSFPMGHAIYDPAHDETPIQLALKLIRRFHPYFWGDLPQFLVMDSGFYSADAMDLLRWWGFKHVSIGGRSNLLLSDGRRLKEARRGERIELSGLPGLPLYVSWVELPHDGKIKRFYVLDTQPGEARTLTRRHKRRWLIESFFKSAKHDFGLKETRLRTETGIENWLFLVWLSIGLALYTQFKAGMTQGQRPAWRLTLGEAAEEVRLTLMPHVIRHLLLAALSRLDAAELTLLSEKTRQAA
ncbi:transposase [Deinococcus wulumuqiensis]|uniref:Transposase IS4-like domain-containing protein n=1 Tax=Deinococcus wulumuqiensis TaxID=980427 RepID=A0AAV4KAR7_9DEIO|nr:transposase [Deinococcus wulumuqiensis]GGI92964.1 hypothetical protein GCM10010914_29290 [Deinococcus wulumuqiensis]GGP31172.1 hypothetical protein GCM10008021_28230 [Deinococcus wulumuqiensis]